MTALDTATVLLLVPSALFVAWALSMLLVVSQRWHGRFTHDTIEGAQKFHSAPTPRIGGIAIVGGCLAAWAIAPVLHPLLSPMLVAGSFAFLAGLMEDVTKGVGVLARLLATMASGLAICIYSGAWLTDVGVPGVDYLLSFAWFAVPFTAIALSGVANSLNMIDGFNGLASGVAIIILLTMGYIAGIEGDGELALLCVMFSAVMAGFLLVNFPLGRIFLGDGGAYFMGFVIGWIAVLLVARNPGVSPWAGMVACAYPVLEMFFSMWRKTRREGHHPAEPDRLHFHMLIHQRIAKKLFRNASAEHRNAMTSPFAWAFALLPAVLAIGFHRSTPLLMVAFVLCAFVYSALYARLTQFRWCLMPVARRRSPRIAG
ncbi:MAG TPA: glycosyltransferase [Pseudomonadales bacterium]|nr:glycosyltransferase [Pseudomonadales bacterium]